VLSFSVDQAERLLRFASSLVSSGALPVAARKKLDRWIHEAQKRVPKAAQHLSEALDAEANGKWSLATKKRSESQQVLGELTQVTAVLLEPSWRAAANASKSPRESRGLKRFRELGEEFLAGRTVLFIAYVLSALRNLGALILSGLLLMLFSVMFYPFVQKNHFLAFNWIVILGFVGVAVLVMLQMEREVVLSMLNGTEPGQVKMTRHFTFRILKYAMIPILLLLAAQFPDTVGQIVSWFSAAQGH
ncbi:MAG: hypothetical protein P8Z30_05445, partial [Acidobacteriota bacterium]